IFKAYEGELKQEIPSSEFYTPMVEALTEFGPRPLADLVTVLGSLTGKDDLRVGWIRWRAHYLGGGDPGAELLLRWLASPAQQPQGPKPPEASHLLVVLGQAWDATDKGSPLRPALAEQVIRVVAATTWKTDDLPVLHGWQERLPASDYPAAATLF